MTWKKTFKKVRIQLKDLKLEKLASELNLTKEESKLTWVRKMHKKIESKKQKKE